MRPLAAARLLGCVALAAAAGAPAAAPSAVSANAVAQLAMASVGLACLFPAASGLLAIWHAAAALRGKALPHGAVTASLVIAPFEILAATVFFSLAVSNYPLFSYRNIFGGDGIPTYGATGGASMPIVFAAAADPCASWTARTQDTCPPSGGGSTTVISPGGLSCPNGVGKSDAMLLYIIAAAPLGIAAALSNLAWAALHCRARRLDQQKLDALGELPLLRAT